MNESTRVAYVYCLVDSPARLTAARGPAGIPGASRPRPVHIMGTLWMIAADAPAAVYGEDALPANLRSLEWVSEVAVAHEAVVEHFARRRNATVVPMKLLTLFTSEERARAELRRRRRAIAAAVRRIAGCEEWGVRIFPEPAREGKARDRRRPASPDSMSGTAFLAARKAARESGQAVRAGAVAAAAEAYDELSACARASRQRPRTAEPGANPPLLDAAFLVVGRSSATFKATARRQAKACAEAGARMTLSGPWPAYNFAGDTGETA
jgi:hypothetical protein